MSKKILSVTIFVLLTSSAFARHEEGGVLTLQEALREVLSHNPDIQAAAYRSQAARSRIKLEKSLDDPMVGVMFDDVPITTSNVKQAEEIDYRIEQKIPFPGKRHVKAKASRFEAEAISQFSSARVRDVLLDVKKTYYEIYRLLRTKEALLENKKVLDQYRVSTETAYAAGKTSADVPLKAQVETTKIENDLLMLDQETATHQAHLKALLNRPGHEDLKLPTKIRLPTLQFSLEEIEEMALHSRPELKQLRAMEQKDKAGLTGAKQSLVPDLSLAFQYGQRPTSPDTWTTSVMVNLPLFMGKNVARIKEAKANLKATTAEHQSMEVHTRHEIKQAYSAVKTSEKVVSSYQKNLLPQIRTTLKSAEIAYASNKADFMTLLDAVRTYLELEVQSYQEEARLGMAFAELERLVGKDLEEHYETKY